MRGQDDRLSLEGLTGPERGIVVNTARKYHGMIPDRRGWDYNDLIQSGVVGVLLARRHYRPECGYPYIKRAALYVRSQILELIFPQTGPNKTRCDPMLGAKPLATSGAEPQARQDQNNSEAVARLEDALAALTPGYAVAVKRANGVLGELRLFTSDPGYQANQMSAYRAMKILRSKFGAIAS